MALDFQIFYHTKVVKEDILHLSSLWRNKIKLAIDEKLTIGPNIYGKPLRRSLKGYRKLRVGDYRVVYRIDGDRVFVLAIMHRSVVYEKMAKDYKIY